MKKKLSMMLTVALAILLVVSAMAVSAGSWTNRKVGASYAMSTALITAKDGKAVSAPGAAVYVKTPVGKQAFKVGFKLHWPEANLSEGMEGYLDNFLSIWVGDRENIERNFAGGPVHTESYEDIGQHFRVEKKHLQSVTKDPNTINQGIVDFGVRDDQGVTLCNMNDTRIVQMYLELKAGEDDNWLLTLSAANSDGDTMGSITFDSPKEGYFEGAEQYLCFGVYGKPLFQLFDVQIIESDIEASRGLQNEFVHNKMVDEENGGALLTPLLENTVIASMDPKGNMISWGTAAAATDALGKQAFDVTFDLVWKSNTNNRDQGGDYSALGIAMTEDPAFSDEIPEGTAITLNDWFELTDRHLELKAFSSGNNATNGFQDFGNAGVLGDAVIHHVEMKLADKMLTLSMCDKTWTLNYAEVSDAPKYLTFALQGPAGIPMTILNFTVKSSDMPDTSAEVVYHEAAAATYTVTFDANGGKASFETAVTGKDGKLSALPDAEKENMTFDGWYTAADGGEKITTDTVFKESVTVYAHWTARSADPGESSKEDGSKEDSKPENPATGAASAVVPFAMLAVCAAAAAAALKKRA